MCDEDVLVKEFQEQSGRRDGLQAVVGLRSGLGLLSDVLCSRLHEDVEKAVGTDSMLVPVSEAQASCAPRPRLLCTRLQNRRRQFGNSATGPPRRMGTYRGLRDSTLGESSLGQPWRQRIEEYVSKSERARRLAFTDVLVEVLPEARQAPLVLFLLFPPAVQIATALAFGDSAAADRFRTSQVDQLPIIASCRECHGRVLENGRCCGICANPLWKTAWLTLAE